ncbi:hypothetical protein GCM10010990_21160 [Croceicoccus mobilis]|uniref:histidine kinase n=1 Tax=Croceicoccus mobilis TaxID=1703339 RepID=A0A916Z1M5_9SPHN|nr:hypothetical protein GCM10010990_21160 [Croceicoccus mobilis]
MQTWGVAATSDDANREATGPGPALGAIILPACAAAVIAHFTRSLGHGSPVPIMWLANAVAVALIAMLSPLRCGTRHSVLAVLASFGALLWVHLLHLPAATAIGLALAHGLEIGAAMIVLRRPSARPPQAGDLVGFGLMIGCFILASMLSAGIASIVLPADVAAMKPAWLWFISHSAALAFVVPLVMSTRVVIPPAARGHRHLPPSGPAAIMAVVLAGTIAVFAQNTMPFLFMPVPLIVLAGLLLGTRGTALALLIVSAIAMSATLMGSGPVVLTRGAAEMQIVTLQAFLAVLVLVGLPLAGVVERARADRAELIASREDKRRVLDNIDEVIFRVDPEGRCVTLNAAWERITGHGLEESLGRPFHEFLGDDDGSDARERFEQLIRGQRGLMTSLHTIHRPDGDIRHVEVRMRAAYDANGCPIGLVGHIRDISERTSNRLALEASERTFATLAAASPAGIWRTNARGEALSVNRAFKEMTGLRDGEWEGTQWADAIHPLDFERVFAEWTAAVSSRGEFRGEWRWQRHDGSIVWVATVGAPHIDARGRLVGYVGINIDITQRREAELRLAERENQIATVFDNVRDALFMIAPDGRCSFVSPSAGSLFDLAPAALDNRPFAQLFHPADAATIEQAMERLWRGEKASCGLVFRLADANPAVTETRWLSAQFSMASDPMDGAPAALIASLRDVTESKRLETELTEARRRAEHAAETKTSFLANMSHEIRTPMNGVIGFTDLLMQSELSTSQRRHVRMISESGRAMLRLLNDILDMSRIESGQMSIQPAPLDLRAKLDSCCSLLEPMACKKGITLSCSIDPAVPTRIVGDPLRVRQILLNLMGNAVKFTDEGTVRVTAQLESAATGSMLAIEVADSGIGIAPDQLDVIFSQFRQGDSSIGRRYGGTGLGLAISAQLAELMGGRIDVRSVIGEGTCFTVRIPLTIADSSAPATSVAADALGDIAEVEGGHDPVSGCPLRVLVAEDHDINQELVMAMCRRAGLIPELARNGEEAVRMVASARREDQPYAMVLMDMQMPVVDGLEATRRIRASGITAEQLPIVALTANCYDEDIKACLDAGMQGHLPKPLQLVALRNAIAMHAVMQHRTPDAQRPFAPPARKPQITNDLSARYTERKRETLRMLAMTAEGIEEPQWDLLAQQLHKLAGSAGYFGDRDLGERARMLQDRLRSTDCGETRLGLVRKEWAEMGNAA